MRGVIFSGVVLALIVILSATLGVMMVTYEPANIYLVSDVDNSDSAANEFFVTSGGISVMYTDSYNFITNDRKSRAYRDMTIYRPVAPAEWYIVGDYCQPSYDWPTKRGIVVRAEEDYLLAPPKDWELVWADHGSGATRDTSIWKAIPLYGYVAIGQVAVQGYSKPVIPEYRCVWGDEVTYTGARLAWSTDGSPADAHVEIYSIVPETVKPQTIDTNTFTAFSPNFPGMIPVNMCLKA